MRRSAFRSSSIRSDSTAWSDRLTHHATTGEKNQAARIGPAAARAAGWAHATARPIARATADAGHMLTTKLGRSTPSRRSAAAAVSHSSR